MRADERTRTADLISSYDFTCVRSSLYWCVRYLRLLRRFSMIRRSRFVHSVPACTSPVAVRVAVHGWSSPRTRDEVFGAHQGMTEVGVGLVSQKAP
jgi:hypothetical protein